MKTLAGLLTIFALTGCAYNPVAYSYFNHLCESESGVHIRKRVSGVESVFQMKRPEKYGAARPPLYDKGGDRTDVKPYWEFRDSWTYDYPKNFRLKFDSGPRFADEENAPFTKYAFFEGVGDPESSNGAYVRLTAEAVLTAPCKTYGCSNQTKFLLTQESTNRIESRYGYTWKEIHPPQFTHHIVGAEWMVIDLSNDEVLATARTFFFTGYWVGGKSGGGASTCGVFEPSEFITRVLEPISIGPRRKVYQELR